MSGTTATRNRCTSSPRWSILKRLSFSAALEKLMADGAAWNDFKQKVHIPQSIVALANRLSSGKPLSGLVGAPEGPGKRSAAAGSDDRAHEEPKKKKHNGDGKGRRRGHRQGGAGGGPREQHRPPAQLVGQGLDHGVVGPER